MGLEFITQPQVFTQRISALGGIEGYVPPFVSTFYTWTTSTGVSASSFPLPGTIGLTDIPGSYIVSVGGVLQAPTNYTISVIARKINFDFNVNPNTDVVVTQIGTVGSTVSGTLPTDTSSTNLSVINLTVVNSIAFFTVSDITAASFTLTNNDSNKIIHCDTTTTPYITAIFPDSLNNGFNVNLFNTGTGTIVVSSTQSPAAFAAGTENNTQYSGMTIYKHNSQLFGMGVFD